MKARKRKCKICKTVFIPQYSSVQPTCSIPCAIEYSKLLDKNKKDKAWKEKKRKIKSSIKTKQEHEKELQAIFNTYIRLRDKDKPCISCGTPLKGKFDAGHFYPSGSYKNLRFDENNVHGQCVYCNQHQHGNLIEYTLRLPNRIGQQSFDKLVDSRLEARKYTIPELILMKDKYKRLVKKYK